MATVITSICVKTILGGVTLGITRGNYEAGKNCNEKMVVWLMVYGIYLIASIGFDILAAVL